MPHGDLDALDDEFFDSVLQTNVRGAFASDGRLGGYSGGLHRKVALLSLEGVDAEGPHAGAAFTPRSCAFRSSRIQ